VHHLCPACRYDLRAAPGEVPGDVLCAV